MLRLKKLLITTTSIVIILFEINAGNKVSFNSIVNKKDLSCKFINKSDKSFTHFIWDFGDQGLRKFSEDRKEFWA